MSGGPPNVTFDKTSLYPTFPTSYENSPASYRVFVDLTTPVKPVVGQYHPASKGKSNKSHSKRGLLFKIKEPLPGNNASLGISVSPSGLRRVEMVPQRAPLETVYRQPPIQAGNIHKPKYQAPQIQQKMQPRPVQQKIPVQKSIQMTNQSFNPDFQLGDASHKWLLDSCIHNPNRLVGLPGEEFQALTAFLVNLGRTCQWLQSCDSKNRCNKLHSLPGNFPQLCAENMPRLLKILFYVPAIRRGLVLKSFAKDHHMRFAAIRDPRDIQRCLLQIRDLSLFSTHPCGYSFNAWCFVKMDLGTGQHSSAVHHFLAMYVAMMRGTEIRFKCTRNDCRSLNCFKTHFDVTTLDQVGALRWAFRLLLDEVNQKWKVWDPSTTNEIVLSCVTKWSQDIQAATSVVSSFSSLMILANLDIPYSRQVILAINEWGDLCRCSLDVRATEPAIQPDSELEIEDLDAGRLLEACVSALSNDSQAHRLLTVSQYGCAIGDSYMAKLMIVFQNTLEEKLMGGSQLPLGMTPDIYEKLVSKDSSNKLVYTMPMHLWLFKTLSTETMAQALVDLSAYRFKTLEKGIETVTSWRSAALSAVQERNPKWLRTMKHPDKHDMRAACENFMPKWIKAFSPVIRKGSGGANGGMMCPSPNIKRKSLMAINAAQLAAESRWEDEVFVRLETDELPSEDELTDWRKICRLLRDLELQPILYHKNSGNTSAAQRREGSEAAAILNYLYQSSNRLKHTDYATFDAEFFLFLAHRLFQLYKARADEGTFSALELVEEPFNGGNGNKNEILKRLRAMNSVESAEMSQKFNELSLEIEHFLPLDGKYISKWKDHSRTGSSGETNGAADSVEQAIDAILGQVKKLEIV